MSCSDAKSSVFMKRNGNSKTERTRNITENGHTYLPTSTLRNDGSRWISSRGIQVD